MSSLSLYFLFPSPPFCSQLLQELEGHSGFVNSLAFDSEGRKLYSGDSGGTVCVWNVFVTEQAGRPGFLRDWTVLQKFAEKEMDVSEGSLN